MAIHKGLVQQPPQEQSAGSSPATVRGRVLETRSRIVTSATPEAMPSRLVTPQNARHEPPVRGLLVDGSGKPLRGLSKATVEAHQAHTATASELCTNCGEMRTPAQMKTVVGNAYNSNNPLRICQACAALAYKDPHNQSERWQPSVPRVRFDRETAAPYDAHERGVRISDLVTKDTYHNEREVAPEYRADTLANEGRWSGGKHGGHVVTGDSVARSRDRAARR